MLLIYITNIFKSIFFKQYFLSNIFKQYFLKQSYQSINNFLIKSFLALTISCLEQLLLAVTCWSCIL